MLKRLRNRQKKRTFAGIMEKMILILRPQQYWAVISAELRRTDSLGRYMELKGSIRSEQLTDSSLSELRKLAEVCASFQSENLYTHYANKKMFRHQKDFWESGDTNLQQYVKRMADQRLLQAVRLANSLDIPILCPSTENSPLHLDDRLYLDEANKVTPIMDFNRHEQGITYQLRLRLGNEERTVIVPASHHLVVLGQEPGLFILDNHLLLLEEGFSGKLLLPFAKKTMVEIPRHLENDYFHRFILKNVSKAKIIAKGFEIKDSALQPCPRLLVENSIGGGHLISLRFQYGDINYSPDSKSTGRVQLQATDDGFSFIRYLRNRQAEQQAIETIGQTGTRLSSGGHIHFDTMSELVDWLRQYGSQLRQEGIEVVQPSEHVYYIGPLNVEQSESWHGDWLQTDVTVILDDGRLRIPFRDLRETILRGEQDYMLPTGERLLIPSEWLQRYGNLLLTGQPHGKGFRRHRSSLFPYPTSTEAANKPNGTSSTTPRREGDISSWKGAGGKSVTLRLYQQIGYEWLWRNFESQTGCCLADEMGLGKTLQTIALLLKYKKIAKTEQHITASSGMIFSEEEMRGNSPDSQISDFGSQPPFHTSLVVAPASVVHNWMNELHRFAPSLLACNYTGDTTTRRDKRQALLRWDVLVTTYRTLVNDIELLAPLQFGIVVFDESQAFKTASSKIHQAVCRLNSLHRMALSGTPVENNLNELWSLMNVLNPHLLGSQRSFQQIYVDPIAKQMEHQRAETLQRLIAPYFLKRTKEEVLNDLPERQDEVVVCPMTDSQARSYAEELSKARNEWLDAQASSNAIPQTHRLNILAAIQRLRHIANGEGKMHAVFERLENLRGTRHKVLLFSEYVTMLQQVGMEMQQRNWSYALLTGETQQRERVINQFQEDNNCQFFLISLKAGGVGLNLTAADYVFILDPWWNQAAEEQAIARSHRIGQHRPVFVYRFVSEGTLEQQILSLQERKQTLIDSVMPFICNT